MTRRATSKLVSILLVLASACDDESGNPAIDLAAGLGSVGKADFAKKAKLVDDVGPDAKVQGTFDPRTRVYGYVVEAKAGARLTVALEATAGADSTDLAAGETLDTVLGVYGPYQSATAPGAQLVQEDDDDDSVAAPPLSFEVAKDGRYLVAFSSWDDTGTGKYALDVSCEGTDFQCRRPDFAKPCAPGQLFLQGGAIADDTTWNTCEVVLLEPTTVAADATLTIRPGVVVKGNFLGTGMFGNVTLSVAGRLQAAGTEAHPIAFTSLKEDRGWAGLVLSGTENSLEHVFIERANVAVSIGTGASASVSDAVIEGGVGTTLSEAGIRAGLDAVATFERALVKGFARGLSLEQGEHIEIVDSIVRENAVGVFVSGAASSLTCGTVSVPQITVWRDPKIVHSDIVDNTQQGIRVTGDDVLLQVEHSNIVGNGREGVLFNSRRLHPDTFIHTSNVHGNNHTTTNAWQIQTDHLKNGGVLDISGNFWVHISDPELSASWRRQCNVSPGDVQFTGFSPTAIADAGPRLDELSKQVLDAMQR